MNKSRIVFITMLVFNLLECAVFPLMLMPTLFRTSIPAMIVLIIIEYSTLLATAVIGNVAAGYSPKTRWYSAVLPTIAYFLAGFLWLEAYYAFDSFDFWIIVFPDVILLIACVISFGISCHKQITKNKIVQNKVIEKNKDLDEAVWF